MSLNNMGNGGFYMPVAPAYGGNYAAGNNGIFGGDGAWWLLLLVLLGGGMWGGLGMGGMGIMGLGGMYGAMGMDVLYPWLSQSREINGGFRDQMLNTQIAGIGDKIASGFGDVQLGIAGINQNICQTGSGITAAINNGFSAAEIAANGRQMANMQQVYGVQSAIQAGSAATVAGIADVKYAVAQEGCNDRAALTQGLQAQTMQEMSNTNALMAALRDGFQSIKDELCNDRLEAERRDNANLRAELLYARGQASQVAQTAAIQQGLVNEVDAVYNRLKNCPVPSTPVYGNQPIFTCPGNTCGGYQAA